VTVKAGRP